MNTIDNPHRRADDRAWYLAFGRTMRSILPPIIAGGVSVVVATVAVLSKSVNMAMALSWSVCLAAAFGASHFDKWLEHRQQLGGGNEARPG